MDKSKFKQMYECSYEPDARLAELDKRLRQYYNDTPDSMSNRSAKSIWKEFITWCKLSGYTSDEVNRAKARVKE